MPNVSLTEPLEEYVDHQIKAGRFANPSEAMRAGMWALMKQDADYLHFLQFRDELRDLAERALAGEGEPFSMEEFEPRLVTGFDKE